MIDTTRLEKTFCLAVTNRASIPEQKQRLIDCMNDNDDEKLMFLHQTKLSTVIVIMIIIIVTSLFLKLNVAEWHN